MTFFKYKRSYVFLRNPIFYLSNQFFFESMLLDIYDPICKNTNLFGGGKDFERIKCKAIFNFFSTFLASYAFLVRMTACTLHISGFPGTENINGLNDLNSLNSSNNLSVLNDLYSLISSKNI